MKKINVSGVAMIAAIFTLCISSAPVRAEDYPTRAITIIAPFAPGGTSDIIARMVAALAKDCFGQPVLVVNKEGAGSLIGLRVAAEASPDGYTLIVLSGASISVIEWEIANGRKPPATKQDFVPIASWAKYSYVVIIPYDSPWKTLNDLISDCKAKPNHYRFSSGGAFSGTHVAVEVLLKAAGITARHVPYKGGGEAVRAIMGGHADFSCQVPSTTLSLYRGKKIRILALMDNEKLADYPEIPTVLELGFPAGVNIGWTGLGAPKNTPIPVVKKLREFGAKVAKDPRFIESLLKLGQYVDYRDGQVVEKDWDIEAKMYAELFKHIIAKGEK